MNIYNYQKVWINLKGTVKKYKVHDNGAKLFLVVTSDNKIFIYKATDLYIKQLIYMKKIKKKKYDV